MRHPAANPKELLVNALGKAGVAAARAKRAAAAAAGAPARAVVGVPVGGAVAAIPVGDGTATPLLVNDHGSGHPGAAEAGDADGAYADIADPCARRPAARGYRLTLPCHEILRAFNV